MNNKGVTLVEAMCTAAVLGLTVLLIQPMLTKPAIINNMLAGSDREIAVMHAADVLTKDIHAADPHAFPWDSLIPTSAVFVSSISFQKTHYDMTNPNVPVNSYVTYYYDAQKAALVRSENGTTTDIATQIMMPTGAFPLVQQDTTTFHMMTLTLLYQRHDRSTGIVVRRVSL